MPKFTGYIRATARVTSEALEVEADTLEEAKAKIRAEGIEPYTFELEDGSDIEGDAIAYIDYIDGKAVDDGPVSVDLPEPGEPFSWAACDLVKQIAKQPDVPDLQLLLWDRDRLKSEIDALRDFIRKARDICNIEEVA